MFSQLAPYIGYLASALLMVGLLVTNDLKFRIWNGLGCLVFIIYAIIIQAFPVLITNVVLLAINIFYFIKILRRKEFFDVCSFESGDTMALKFIDFYKEDILSYFPKFRVEDLKENLNIVILRDLVVANMFSGTVQENGELLVDLNYTVPKYRDYKVGKYLFSTGKNNLTSRGVNKVKYEYVWNNSHKKFLLRSGFTLVGNENGKMEKNL